MQIVPYTTNEVMSLLLYELKLTLNNYSDTLTRAVRPHVWSDRRVAISTFRFRR